MQCNVQHVRLILGAKVVERSDELSPDRVENACAVATAYSLRLQLRLRLRGADGRRLAACRWSAGKPLRLSAGSLSTCTSTGKAHAGKNWWNAKATAGLPLISFVISALLPSLSFSP